MRLTKQTGYAIRILLHCALTDGRYVKVTEIARRNQITEHNIFKIVPILAQSGFIEALRGRNGGIKLARPAEEIRIGDVVRATEATHVEADCFGVGSECAIRPVAPINLIRDMRSTPSSAFSTSTRWRSSRARAPGWARAPAARTWRLPSRAGRAARAS